MINRIILKKNKQKGFTLVETLVALALFSVVLVISGGVIVSIININKKNQAISSVVSNLNYSIDSMIRDIKTGYMYKCNIDGSVVTGNDKTVEALKLLPATGEGVCDDLVLISTISGDDTVVEYRLVKSVDGNNFIEKTVYTAGVTTPYSITDKINVDISSLLFEVRNPLSLDDADINGKKGQPTVFIVIKGKSGAENVEASDFFVQTLISQRLPNLTNFKENATN